jgi:hypothetical protein
MSELISNQTFRPEPGAVDSVQLPADTGPAESAPPKVVVRYQANADSPDPRDTLEDEADPNEPDTASTPDRGSGGHRGGARVLAGALVSSLRTITKAGVHGVIRYPRSSAVAVLSLLILGAILRTQPDKPTPPARIDQRSPAEKKGHEEKKGTNSNIGPIADNDHPSNAQTENNPANGSAKPPVSPRNPGSTPLSPPPDDAVAQAQTQRRTGNPGTENEAVAGKQAPAPAPARVAEQGGPALLTPPFPESAPAPLPSSVSSPTPVESGLRPGTTNSTPSDSGPALPAPAPSSEETLPDLPSAPSSSVSPPGSTSNQSADLVLPPLGEELTRTDGNKRLDSPSSPATPNETVGSPSDPAKESAANPRPASQMPQTVSSPPEPTKMETTPKPSASQGSIPEAPASQPETPRSQVPVSQPSSPRPDQPKDAPTPSPVIPPSESTQPKAATPALGQSGPGTTTGSGPSRLEVPATTPETPEPGSTAPQATPAVQGLKPESGGATPDTKLEPANPALTQTAPHSDSPQPQVAPGAETAKPGILKVEDLRSDTTAMPPRSPGPADEPTAKVEQAPNPTSISAQVAASEPPGPRTGDLAPPSESAPTRPAEPTRGAPGSAPGPLPDESVAKRVRLPSTGKISDVLGDGFDRLGEAVGIAAEPSRDTLAHADKDLSFDLESFRDHPSTRTSQGADRAEDRPPRRPAGSSMSVGSRLSNEPRSEAGSPRVEAVPHNVERGENFWTISRLYYNSGRYYRALWKANSRKVPKIDELPVNERIVIPPVEDLDPAYIEPPRVRSAVGGMDRGSPGARIATSAPVAGQRESLPTARMTRTSRLDSMSDNPSSRSDRPEAVLNLPIGDIGFPRSRGSRRNGSDETDEDVPDDGTEIRTTARPRVSVPVRRPIYKVRRYETLRSIARDTLGDPRRAREILELNRGIIDDPTNLISGQLIELPEDADTRRVTIRDRY